MEGKNPKWKDIFAEIKIGIFVIVAIFLFFITIISIRQISFFKGTYPLAVTFNFVEGLKAASPVRFCGVDIGEVDHLEIRQENGNPIVYVFLKIEDDVLIPRATRFFINSLSLFGEKYLEIMPLYTGEEDYYQPGETIKGIESPPLFDVMAAIQTTMQKITNLVEGNEFSKSLQETAKNIHEISFDFKDILNSIKKQKGTIGRLFYDDSIYQHLDEMFLDLKRHPWKLLYKPKNK